MGPWTKLKEKLNGGERVLVVWSREHHIALVKCVIDTPLRLVRSGTGQSWPKPEFDPKSIGKDMAYLAVGEKIILWPTREKPAYDVMDDGTKVEITPEYLDLLTRDSDTEAWLRGVRGMSLMDRLIHLGAGAAIGMVLTFFLLKLIGFAASTTGSGTTVTITNTTANSTTLATAIILPYAAHLASALPGVWPF